MKDSKSIATPTKRGSWLLMAVVGLCAAGAGVTGTLLWLGSRQPATTGTGSAEPLKTPAGTWKPMPGDEIPALEANSALGQSQPPASLTAGLAPAAAAVRIGNWNFDRKAWPAAAASYRRAIALGVNNPDVRTDFGSALRFAGQPHQALEQYQLAHRQNPHHENSLYNQGGVYAFDLHQPAKGIAIWRKYLQQFPAGHNSTQARELIAKAQQQSK